VASAVRGTPVEKVKERAVTSRLKTQAKELELERGIISEQTIGLGEEKRKSLEGKWKRMVLY